MCRDPYISESSQDICCEKISFVVPFPGLFGTENFSASCLRRLFHQSYADRAEIITIEMILMPYGAEPERVTV